MELTHRKQDCYSGSTPDRYWECKREQQQRSSMTPARNNINYNIITFVKPGNHDGVRGLVVLSQLCHQIRFERKNRHFRDCFCPSHCATKKKKYLKCRGLVPRVQKIWSPYIRIPTFLFRTDTSDCGNGFR